MTSFSRSFVVVSVLLAAAACSSTEDGDTSDTSGNQPGSGGTGQFGGASSSSSSGNANTGGPYGISTVEDANGGSACPDIPQGSSPPPKAPSQAWSKNTLTADCAGHFKLCYELKAGSFDNPSTSDCSLAKVCVEADYVKEN